MTMKVIRSEIPDIGAGANRIDADAQLKAIVDEFIVPQLGAMAKAIAELRNIVVALNKQVEELAEKQRTIHVHIDYPVPPTVPSKPYVPWTPNVGDPIPYPGTTWSSKENKGEGTNQENK